MACTVHLLLLLLLLLPLATSRTGAQSNSANMTRGTTITARGSTAVLPSPSGDFAFGFFPINSSTTSSSSQQLFLLGVWFDVTSPKTLVWVANRNAPVQAGSTFQFTSDGSLSLRDHTNQEIWSPGFFIKATNLAVLDDGNLVLTSATSTSSGSQSFLWQSFSHPTDTLLPGQVLAEGTSMRSQLTATDFSDGRFKLISQTDGNLVLYPLEIDTGYQYKAYWASNTVGFGKQLVYNQSGSINFALENGTLINILTSTVTYSPVDFYQRATLDSDGVFRQYVYPKAAGMSRNGRQFEKRWNPVYILPGDICTAVSNEVGSGACGFNSYCSLPDDQLGLANCNCPPQYSFIDSQKKYKGCKADFVPQSCDKDDSADFDFTPMLNTDWPLSDYTKYTTVDQQQCMQFCLEDCLCAMTAYDPQNSECFKKKTPLTDGRMGGTETISLIKVPKVKRNATSPVTLAETVVRKDRRTLFAIGVLFLGISALLILVSFARLPRYINMKKSQNITPERVQGSMSDLNLRLFTYKELEKATNGFSEEVGRGASGVVYKGYLAPSSFTTANYVAVKKLDKMFQESDKEFKNELRSIGQAHHKNLVKLIGLCEEETHRLLVYEYMRNGSLMSFLFGGNSRRPSWNQRVHIALGIARGLLYLHDECVSQIIHCDVKPQNVLLDNNFAPRISDFGMAKLLRTDQTRTTTGIRGTRGYLAPEWFKSMPITNKVDVYSFGVMLLELVCCRRNLEMDPVAREVDEPVLIYWAYDNYKSGRLRFLLWDDDEEAMSDLEKVTTFVKVAIWCIQEDPVLRPSMNKVSQMLEGSTAVASPPDPFPFSSRSTYR